MFSTFILASLSLISNRHLPSNPLNQPVVFLISSGDNRPASEYSFAAFKLPLGVFFAFSPIYEKSLPFSPIACNSALISSSLAPFSSMIAARSICASVGFAMPYCSKPSTGFSPIASLIITSAICVSPRNSSHVIPLFSL